MKRYDFPALDERYFETTLSCGLRVRVIPKPGFSKTYAVMAVNYGAIDTAFTLDGRTRVTPNGVAHYLEHKMFDMPYGDAMNRFSQFGGNPNAFTSYTMTAYYVECTERLRENLQTLVEFVTTPYFTEQSVEKERGIIAQEIRMYEDSPGSRVYENLFRGMYRNHPVRVPIAGTVESIQEITTGTLELCHRAFYAPGNAMLCVAGDVDPEEIAKTAEEQMPRSMPAMARREYGPAEEPTPAERTVRQEMEISMPTFLLGFKGVPPKPGMETMKREFVGDLTADLMLGPTSPLYSELYGEGLVDGGFSAGYEGMRGVSLFSAGGESKDPDAVVERIFREAERIRREGFDPNLFRCLKQASLGRKVRELDSLENICLRSCETCFDDAEYFRMDEVLQSVTPEDVQAFAEEYLREDRATVSVIYPNRKRSD